MIEPSKKKKSREIDRRLHWGLGNAIVTLVALACLILLPIYEKTEGDTTSYLSCFKYAASLENAKMWLFLLFAVLLSGMLTASITLFSINALSKKNDLEKKDKFFSVASIINIVAYVGFGLFGFALNLLISMAICIVLAVASFIGMWVHFKYFSCLAD